MSGPSNTERQHYGRELIERRREDFVLNRTREELEHIHKGLLDQVSTSDPQVIDDLVALGFTADTVSALSFIPLIQVAWADGEVSAREARRIMEHASEAGLDFGGPAYRLIDMLLGERPTDDFMTSCLYVLRNWFRALPDTEASHARQDLLSFARVVAEASGGVLGLFGEKVDHNEQQILDRFQGLFGNDGAAALHLDLMRDDDA